MDPQDTHIWPIILCSSWKTLERLLFGKGSVLCIISVIAPLLLHKNKIPYRYSSKLKWIFAFTLLLPLLP
jgi:hypothetical protein